MAGAFEYRQAEEIRDAFVRRGVRYLFLDKSGMILLGFPDTTQDADVYVEKSPENGQAIVRALVDIGFTLADGEAQEIIHGKDFVQSRMARLTSISSLLRMVSSGSQTRGRDA